MDMSTVEETRLVSGIDPLRFPSNKPIDSSESVPLFADGAGKSYPVNVEDSTVKEMDEPNASLLPRPIVKYGYLEHIQSYKSSCTPDDKSLPEKVRQFYADQLEFINSIEAILLPKTFGEEINSTDYQKQQERNSEILSMLTLIINIFVAIIKTVAAIMSKSLSVISTLVDSAVDLLFNIMLIWTARKIKRQDAYKYPTGRTRLEPVTIVILSVIMCSASIEVILESSRALALDIDYFANPFNASSCRTLQYIDMSTLPVIAMVFTIVSKIILFVLCSRINNPTMSALAEDNRNDVLSNSVALVCGVIGSNALQRRIRQEAIIVDPIAAIIISIYIIVVWIRQGHKQVRRLTGLTADPFFLQRLTHIIYNFRPDLMTRIKTVQAVHHGTDFIVEVEIILSGSTPLAIAHNAGEELQRQLQRIPHVERAFVHLDFEIIHVPTLEDIIV
ncbi:unnamed protein product [Rotaria magnacalcarata]|uniref:Cation efflux protein transmembrane domain-containing protein n=1 Tax=Rotaria magnacalcarata TaxID=392030 RepID=A0A819RY61_9BILA|nr:unnamed protein product [Rotaria magnacalcarata]CAF1960666.1 unnamed protein product [Rotaria magnacalcarata]CAF3964279.1 unnamed protein product [Rotaria magnacalcarata]CAF4054307.1 unnamed protein product [Rotaria magnacalcarata]